MDSSTANAARVVKNKSPRRSDAKSKITAADAARIHQKRLGEDLKPQSEPVVRLLPFRDCHRRAWENAHGDPDLQGVSVFGDLEDLNRDGHCWSVEARYRGRHIAGYIDEFGDVIYAFQP